MINHQMGGILDWFSSSSSSFTRQQNIDAGNAWLRAVFNEVKPNATFDQFIYSLKQDGYGALISDEDFMDFLDTVGFNYNTSKAITDKVKASLVATFSKDKNMLPTRRSIISAFLNPDNVKWTYWDVTKTLASQAASATSSAVKTAASAVSTGADVLGFIVKYRTPIILLTLTGAGWFLYQNRAEVGARIKEKGMRAMGLAKNPCHGRRK